MAKIHLSTYLIESPLNNRAPFQTDDKGVFHTSLSREYEIAGTTFDLGREELAKLCVASVQYAFATTEEKNMLLSKINKFNYNACVKS